MAALQKKPSQEKNSSLQGLTKKQMQSQPIFSLRVAEVFNALETSPDGLQNGEVLARQALYGKNALTEEPRQPAWQKMLGHLKHPMALVLWVAGLITLVQEPILGAVIWGVVLVNAIFSYWREHRAEEAMTMLKQLLPSYARLIREGVETKIPASEVVPGDVLVLAEGDHIPADARVVEEYGLRVNNATLTGEAVPARKTADASFRAEFSEVERPNLIFAGTSVVSGTGQAVVYATGMLTQFGRIARLTQVVEEDPSPLQMEMARLTRVISLVAIGLGCIVFAVAAFDVGFELAEAFLLGTGIIVAALPEGLPATVTLSLAMAAQRLAQRGVLVKKLSVVETLGNVSVICTDKSGTLTQNQMTVRQVWAGGQRLVVSGSGYDPHGSYFPNPDGAPFASDLHALLAAAMLCNNARLNPPTPENPQWSCLGDQTEAALRVAAQKGGSEEETLNRSFPRVHELPFDARRKRMSTIHRVSRQAAAQVISLSSEFTPDQQVAFVKGAPREVLQLCTRILMHGQALPLDEARRAEIMSMNDEYAHGALRVLALARKELPRRSGSFAVEKVENELTFLGLMAMMDPPRAEVAEAVEVIRQAGIRIVMITGDYGLTAVSLARRVGMLTSAEPLILTGAELDALDDFHLQAYLDKEVIFARMAPEHKLRLVAAYQARGEVVAVTGDGVNDAPALRKADIGVVMGVTGTDVAKEAADVILTNDNFATITNAIEEGRAVFDNLRKFITYIFSSNIPEILPFLVTATSRTLIPLALTVKQILAIDLGTDLLPALALGTEKPEPDVMKRPPRRRATPIVDQGLLRRAFLWLGMIEAALCYLAFFGVNGWNNQPLWQILPLKFIPWHTLPLASDLIKLWDSTTGEQRMHLAQTVFYAGVVMAQIGNAFACRTEKNRSVWLGWFSNRLLLLGILAEVIMLLLLVYFPPLTSAFGHHSIPLFMWGALIFFGLILYSLEWIRKSILRWRGQAFNGGGN